MIRDLDLTFAMNQQAFTFYKGESLSLKPQQQPADGLSFLKLLCLNFYNTPEPQHSPSFQTLKQELFSYVLSLGLPVNSVTSITDMLEILKKFIENSQCNNFPQDQLRKIWLKYYFSDNTNNKSIFVTTQDEVKPKETITSNSRNCIEIESEQQDIEALKKVDEKQFRFCFDEGVLVLPTVVKKVNGREVKVEKSPDDSIDVDFRDFLRNNMNL